MKAININILNFNNQTQRTSGRNANMFQANDTISALLQEFQSNKAVLRVSDDLVFTADRNSIDGNIGDTLHFKVNQTKDGFTLTQIKNVIVEQRGNARAYDEIKEFSNSLEKMQEVEELRADYKQQEAKKEQEAIAAIKRAQTRVAGSEQVPIARAIIESGLDISKISFAAFNRISQHVDKRPIEEITPQKREENIKTAEKYVKEENARPVADSLYNNGLQVTEKNASTMQHAADMLPEKLENGSIAHIIKTDSDITLENVYKSGKITTDQKLPNSPWDLLFPQISRVFEQTNIPQTEENLNAARFLIERGLPMTRESIEKVHLLMALPATVQQNAFRSLFFDSVAANISEGRPIATNIRLDEIAKMAEIQLKVAIQTAIRHEGLNLNIEPLRQAVRSFQLGESEAMRYFQIVDGEVSSANALRLVGLYDRLSNISPLTVNIHGGVAKGHIPFTIEAVHESVLYARANSAYEQFATVPDPKYGDSFAKVKGQFEPLLNNLGFNPTSENLKASFILSKNNMEITERNIDIVKEIDTKINYITNRLSPMIAAQIIKEGLNPLNMNIDQVVAYIKKYNKLHGIDGDAKIAENILSMDKAGSIDPETRKSMIALYRMLNVIQKEGSQALGLAAKLKSDISLGELMELSRNYHAIKSGRVVDVKTAETELDEMIKPDNNIRASIEHTNMKYSDADLKIDNLVEYGNIKTLVESSSDSPLEDIPITAEKQPMTTVLEQINSFITANPATIHFLQKHGISATPRHAKALDKINESSTALEDSLQEIQEELDIQTADLHDLQNGISPRQIMAKLIESIKGLQTDSTPILAVTQGLNDINSGSGFTMPIIIDGQVRTLKLYVLNEKALTENDATIYLSVTTGIGLVSAYFSIRDSEIAVMITAETSETLYSLEANKHILENLLEQAGVKYATIDFALANEENTNEVKEFTPETDYDYKV